ncbi:pyridoxamine 5'-phosphate oxidase family protein [Nocardioides terrisoli]|uniref:pyridoxamine 5'-phosphate oxidase family protein n=1 Tax=Nocardioides terrisoli TaxID=3388267 RepID=UPI00287B7CAE|nr:pyridoxamine 5'-phosphate oxidase family protein [Nocardioides marmorisolisilvae]
MASGRSAVRLTERELDDFLAANLKVQVATVGPDGAPHLTTLFYTLVDGRIAFWTYRSSQKIANLRRDARISCLVEDGTEYAELRGVSIQGTARLVEELDEVRALGTRVVSAMAGGADLGELGDQIVDGQARKRVGVVVEPVKVASWDHRKMNGALPRHDNGA